MYAYIYTCIHEAFLGFCAFLSAFTFLGASSCSAADLHQGSTAACPQALPFLRHFPVLFPA